MTLVTSANGNLGGDVVAALLEARLPVLAFMRRKSHAKPELARAELCEGDLFDRSSVERAMEGVDVVFHIAPEHHPGEFPLGQTVIDAARAGQAERFVLLSVSR